MVSVVLSWLSLVAPYLENDYSRPDYYASNASDLLTRSFNMERAFVPATATGWTTGVSRTEVSLSPAYPRKLLYEELSAPAPAIQSLREMDRAALDRSRLSECGVTATVVAYVFERWYQLQLAPVTLRTLLLYTSSYYMLDTTAWSK
ncbi:hypothetical protein, variant [Saprolegnia diclina VS20]|uniref:Uncharacterized protein n=1 Tax=Saprolegnia diclina (strain VS20) TaxID=1156394 RepID=T0SE59_SAPDV|nr:hypothetical protein SDRG_01148 [Saprolegnia diclina VS20]XP_008604886.1 hypothetical protein, variant [Saprolegnia diclina VS20]EQC41171.1 hypothetical protein SDRG_01148 [Saprolegnia diclina VS20]EQC41172.1 hypothetical protein, variant [Saprolegnia diclina VS20]|eukprot:XP_008604885.1 hypothetical protein SDRG_01148 [Saprolegnia diclina VS20]